MLEHRLARRKSEECSKCIRKYKEQVKELETQLIHSKQDLADALNAIYEYESRNNAKNIRRNKV